MKKISEMEGSELRRFLKIESVCDSEDFDAWDDAHPGNDFFKADERRKELIDAIIKNGFSGLTDEEAEEFDYFFEAIHDVEDKEAIANELVTLSTHPTLFESVIENMQIPEDITIDQIIELSRAELVANFSGSCVEDIGCI